MADIGKRQARTRAVLQDGVMYLTKKLTAVDQLIQVLLYAANKSFKEDRLPRIYAAFNNLKQILHHVMKDPFLDVCKTEVMKECLRACHVNIVEVKMISLDNKDDTIQSLLIGGDQGLGRHVMKWLMKESNRDIQTETETETKIEAETETHDIQEREQGDKIYDIMKNYINRKIFLFKSDLYFMFSEVLHLMTSSQKAQEIMLSVYEEFRRFLSTLAASDSEFGIVMNAILDSEYPNLQRMDSEGKEPLTESEEEIAAFIGVQMDKLVQLFCEQILRLTFLRHEPKVRRKVFGLLRTIEDCERGGEEIESIVEQLKKISI